MRTGWAGPTKQGDGGEVGAASATATLQCQWSATLPLLRRDLPPALLSAAPTPASAANGVSGSVWALDNGHADSRTQNMHACMHASMRSRWRTLLSCACSIWFASSMPRVAFCVDAFSSEESRLASRSVASCRACARAPFSSAIWKPPACKAAQDVTYVSGGSAAISGH